MPEYIKPAIISIGNTLYPTNVEWLIAFAVKGCKWAEDNFPVHQESARKTK